MDRNRVRWSRVKKWATGGRVRGVEGFLYEWLGGQISKNLSSYLERTSRRKFRKEGVEVMWPIEKNEFVLFSSEEWCPLRDLVSRQGGNSFC